MSQQLIKILNSDSGRELKELVEAWAEALDVSSPIRKGETHQTYAVRSLATNMAYKHIKRLLADLEFNSKEVEGKKPEDSYKM